MITHLRTGILRQLLRRQPFNPHTARAECHRPDQKYSEISGTGAENKRPKNTIIEAVQTSIQVQTSQLDGRDAGQGVFALRDIMRGEAVCLYPGVHTPAIPLGIPCAVPDFVCESYRDNAYVLNLNTNGGVIDGLSVEKHILSDALANPYAVGHKVNHAPTKNGANCSVLDFRWSDVFYNQSDRPGEMGRRRDGSHGDYTPDLDLVRSNAESPSTEPQTEGVANGHSLPLTNSDAPQTWVGRTEDRAQESDTHAPDSGYYAIPNVLAHGSLWYVNELTGEVVHHPPPSHSQAQAVRSGVCGAVFISTQDIKAGDELFIDYQLAGPPYPEWARDWYS